MVAESVVRPIGAGVPRIGADAADDV